MKCISWSQCFKCFFSPWWCSPRPSLHTPPSPFSLLLTNGAQYASFEYSTSSPKSAEFDAFFPESEPIFSPLVTINARVITTPPHLTDEVVFWVMNIFFFFFSLFLKADFEDLKSTELSSKTLLVCFGCFCGLQIGLCFSVFLGVVVILWSYSCEVWKYVRLHPGERSWLKRLFFTMQTIFRSATGASAFASTRMLSWNELNYWFWQPICLSYLSNVFMLFIFWPYVFPLA